MPARIGRQVMYALVDAAVGAVRARASHIDTEMVRANVTRQERFARGAAASYGVESRSDEDIEAVLREALWRATSRFTRRRADAVRVRPTWSPPVATALERAVAEADRAGVAYVGLSHVLARLLALDEADDPQRTANLLVSGEPFAPQVAILGMFGCIDEREPMIVRGIQAMLRRYGRRRHGASWVLIQLEFEALRQAVLADEPTTTMVHLLLAILSLDEQLRVTGLRLTAPAARYNTAGPVLSGLGIDADKLHRARGPATAPQTNGCFFSLGAPMVDSDVVDALRRSVVLAQERGDVEAGTLHLLLAMVEGGGLMHDVLTTTGVDAGAMYAAVSERLSAASPIND